MDPARKLPTMADIDALPSGIKGEIIEGVLYTMTRPRGPHQRVGLAVGSSLRDPFDRGRDGPGGWLIVPEPGIELPGTPEISPNVAGWRRERLTSLPMDAPISVVPDWVCEILSPTTRRHDTLIKKPYYAKIGVPHHWLIDLEARTLMAYRLSSGLASGRRSASSARSPTPAWSHSPTSPSTSRAGGSDPVTAPASRLMR